MREEPLEARIARRASMLLRRRRFVEPIDVLCRLGLLSLGDVDDWRLGRIEHLEPADPAEVRSALKLLEQWATDQGLSPEASSYISKTRDRRPLRFTSSGDAEWESRYGALWMPRELSTARRRQLVRQHSQPPDLVVVMPLNEVTCVDCGEIANWISMENDEPHCLDCVDMGHLVFLPSGDAALSRRAKKASRLSAVVVRFSRRRKQYERQGIFVEEAALELAEEQCLADADIRERRRLREGARRELLDVDFQHRFAEHIRLLYPGCPEDRATEIARHTGTRGSGRVGRSAAGRAFDQDAVTLAVVASIRHGDTDYDELLMSGLPREEARATVAEEIDAVLDRWSRR